MHYTHARGIKCQAIKSKEDFATYAEGTGCSWEFAASWPTYLSDWWLHITSKEMSLFIMCLFSASLYHTSHLLAFSVAPDDSKQVS